MKTVQMTDTDNSRYKTVITTDNSRYKTVINTDNSRYKTVMNTDNSRYKTVMNTDNSRYKTVMNTDNSRYKMVHDVDGLHLIPTPGRKSSVFFSTGQLPLSTGSRVRWPRAKVCLCFCHRTHKETGGGGKMPAPDPHGCPLP